MSTLRMALLASLAAAAAPAPAAEAPAPTPAAAAAPAPATPAEATLPPLINVATGEKLEIPALKGRFTALHFLLKTECPVCLRHTRTYLENAPRLADARQIFIKPDSQEAIEEWVGKVPEPAVAEALFRDPDAALAKALRIPDGYKFHGEVVHFPALIILNAKGEEVFRFVGTSNTQRYSWDLFAEQLDAQTQKAGSPPQALRDGIALGGFDPVSYQAGGPKPGQESIVSVYKGGIYRFTSAENRIAFAKDPARYAPQFGGFCAATLAQGSMTPGNPENFLVQDGALYLFAKSPELDGRAFWQANAAELLPRARQVWGMFGGNR